MSLNVTGYALRAKATALLFGEFQWRPPGPDAPLLTQIGEWLLTFNTNPSTHGVIFNDEVVHVEGTYRLRFVVRSVPGLLRERRRRSFVRRQHVANGWINAENRLWTRRFAASTDPPERRHYRSSHQGAGGALHEWNSRHARFFSAGPRGPRSSDVYRDGRIE